MLAVYDGIHELRQARREGRLASAFRLKVREGIYEVRINDIGVFSALVEPAPCEDEPQWREGVELQVPKIDVSMLMEMIGTFKRIYELRGPIEAVLHVYWSPVTKRYYVHCPEQKTTGVRIMVPKWDNERCERDVLVLEIHSHHIMNAFFSSIDDEYERATRFYAVVGKIDQFFPELRLRYANARRHIEVPPETLFCYSWNSNHVEKVGD